MFEPVHVTVPGLGGRARRAGLAIHRGQAPTTTHRGVPVTVPLRTLRDLRAGRRTYERAVSEAQRLRLIGPADAARLQPDGRPAANRLERLFLGLCKRHGIPTPVCQAEVGPYRVDFLWPAHSVIVETDGHAAHGTRTAFDEDRARDAVLVAAGHKVLRFTWRQLTERDGWVAQTLRAALTV